MAMVTETDGERRSLEEVHGSVAVSEGSTLKRLFAFMGPAYLVSVGYMDPGNWATDLEGGARFGYALVWVLLMSNLMAVLLQTLSARLGVVTGFDLAQACRAEYSRRVNFALWVLAEVAIAATDLGTGARTILTQIAADALNCPVSHVVLRIGDSSLPPGSVAGGSSGTSSWGWAVTKACQALGSGDEATYDTSDDVADLQKDGKHAFGAHFAEVRVDADTGEVRVSRLFGMYAAGRIINPRTARSQFIGGMTMGMGMALHEEGVLDPAMGEWVNHDLAEYHVPAHADVEWIDAAWIDEDDDQLNPMGTKGIGEIGIVGTAAAVANAVQHATGVRVRDLPILPEKLLGAA